MEKVANDYVTDCTCMLHINAPGLALLAHRVSLPCSVNRRCCVVVIVVVHNVQTSPLKPLG